MNVRLGQANGLVEKQFVRAQRVVWRVLRDRVMVHRVDASPDSASTDLIGPVALVWLALDEPASMAEVTTRLAEESVEVADVEAELGRLVAAGLVLERDSEPGGREAIEPLMAVGRLAVYDTAVLVNASAPLVTELASALADLIVSTDRHHLWEAPGHDDPLHFLQVEQAGERWTVRWDGEPSYSGQSMDLALYDALIVLNQHAARTAVAAGRTVLHGGSVVIAGRAVVLVGHSGAGKSTLTAALARKGHAYLADEVVAIDGNHLVDAFHRPIGLRSGGAAALGVHMPDGPYDSILPFRPGPPLGDRAPLGVVVVLRRSETPVGVQLTELNPPQALIELTNQTLGATGGEREMFRRLDEFVRTARVVELIYSDLSEVVAVLEAAAVEPGARRRTE